MGGTLEPVFNDERTLIFKNVGRSQQNQQLSNEELFVCNFEQLKAQQTHQAPTEANRPDSPFDSQPPHSENINSPVSHPILPDISESDLSHNSDFSNNEAFTEWQQTNRYLTFSSNSGNYGNIGRGNNGGSGSFGSSGPYVRSVRLTYGPDVRT